MKDKLFEKMIIFLAVVILIIQVINLAGIRYLLAQEQQKMKETHNIMYRETPAHNTKTL